MNNVINVEGMSCGHCQKAVSKMIAEIDGVSNVEVSLENEQASFDSDNETINRVVEAINESSFKASL